MRPHHVWLVLLFLVVAGPANAHAQATACLPAPAGLVAWWPGDGNANDIAGTNNGTLQGGATATGSGVVGPCFSFDGTNGYVQIPDSPILQPTNLTIEAWVRFNSLNSTGSGPSPAGEQYIVFKQNTRSNFFEGYFLGKGRLAARDFLVFGVSSAAGQNPELDSVTTVTTGLWYHVAGVRGSNYLQLYVNGQLDSQTNISFSQDYTNLPLYLGSSGQAYWDHKLNGLLDEVSLYNRPLAPAEIAAIYAAGSQGKCKVPDLVSIGLVPGNSQTTEIFPMLSIGGLPGQTGYIQRSPGLSQTNGWIGVTNITLVGSSAVWIDPDPATAPRRFYRITNAVGPPP